MSAKDAVRVTLRLPKSLHAQLEAVAQREGVSLNSAIVLNLTNCLQCYSLIPHTGRDRVADQPNGAP